MEKPKEKLKDKVSLPEGYNPLNEDMTRYNALQSLIPASEDAYKMLNPHELEKLAMLFQGGIFGLNEVKARATIYSVRCRATRENKLTVLKGIVPTEEGKKEPSEATRERIAKSDEQWQKLRDTRAEVKVIVEFIENMTKAFYSAHYMCKGLLNVLSDEDKISRFEGDPSKMDNEKPPF